MHVCVFIREACIGCDRARWHKIAPAPLQVSELERGLQEERAAEKAEAAPLSAQARALAMLTCCVQPRVFSLGVLALLTYYAAEHAARAHAPRRRCPHDL